MNYYHLLSSFQASNLPNQNLKLQTGFPEKGWNGNLRYQINRFNLRCYSNLRLHIFFTLKNCKQNKISSPGNFFPRTTSWRNKNHTCEEGGAYLRISFWHLLMNLKSNDLLKKTWIGPIKNVRILIFTMLYFLIIIKKNT